MDDPARCRLRPARSRGLTSPDPVTASLRPQRPPEPDPEPGTPDKPQNRQTAESARPIHCQDQINRPLIPSSHHKTRPVDRGLGAPSVSLNAKQASLLRPGGLRHARKNHAAGAGAGSGCLSGGRESCAFWKL